MTTYNKLANSHSCEVDFYEYHVAIGLYKPSLVLKNPVRLGLGVTK